MLSGGWLMVILEGAPAIMIQCAAESSIRQQ